MSRSIEERSTEVRCACGRPKVAHTAVLELCPNPYEGYRRHECYTPVTRWAMRVHRLVTVRGMNVRAAQIVVNAAMYEVGCIVEEKRNSPAADVM